MDGPLATLLAQQRRRRMEDVSFAGHLDPGRTVFLEEIIHDARRPERLALLAAPWLDAPRFTERMDAACAWLEEVTRADGVKGWDGLPLIFFQAGSDEEDGEEHLRRCQDRFYAERLRHLPPAVQYLHTRTNVYQRLEGAWEDRRLRIGSLNAIYSSYRKPLVYDGDLNPQKIRGFVIGYRLTDYPWILAVSPLVATDYLARIVVHDLCHAFLPSTPSAAEGFHNVAALDAMGELPPIPYRDAWETFVHAECTDPTFCLRAGREIADVRQALGIPSLVQEDFLAKLAKWYVHPEALRKRDVHWGIPMDAPEDEQADLLRRRIREAQADGFRLNIRLMKAS